MVLNVLGVAIAFSAQAAIIVNQLCQTLFFFFAGLFVVSGVSRLASLCLPLVVTIVAPRSLAPTSQEAGSGVCC